MLLSDAVKKPKKQAKKQVKAQPKAQVKTQFVSGNEDDFYARFEGVTEITEAGVVPRFVRNSPIAPVPSMGWPSKANLDKVLKQRRLWTMIEGDDGSLYFVPGFRYVNRLSHWASQKPYPQGFDAEYRLHE